MMTLGGWESIFGWQTLRHLPARYTVANIGENYDTRQQSKKKTKGGQMNDKDRRENYILDISHTVKIDKWLIPKYNQTFELYLD